MVPQARFRTPGAALWLPPAAERWWRARFAAAGVAAIGGVVAASCDSNPTATALLAMAVAVAVTTLGALEWIRHGVRLPEAASIRAVGAVLFADVTIALAFVGVAPPLLACWVAPIALAAIALEIHLLASLSAAVERRSAREREERLHRARESLGIVRARTDSLRLALEALPLDAPSRHDLELLEQHADEAQQALRDVHTPETVSLPALPARSGAESRDRQPWRSESRPKPS